MSLHDNVRGEGTSEPGNSCLFGCQPTRCRGFTGAAEHDRVWCCPTRKRRAELQRRVRSVNNRYLKLSTRLPDSHTSLEREIEKTIRDRIRRGTVSIVVKIAKSRAQAHYRVNTRVLHDYLQQLEGVVPEDSNLAGHLLSLPGVVEETTSVADPMTDWPTIRECLLHSIEDMERMRRDEGAAMQQELSSCSRIMADLVRQIEGIAPTTVIGYRDRLHERLRNILDDYGVSVSAADLVREVSIFAERADIAEEITRLKSHLAQFDETLGEGESFGRKLEFLSQEMYRESNTIGSKASDVEIAKLVVELKSNVERIREIIQNVE
ncbi:MAG: YicC/YloC family endoribonuclease [Planctomycetota bacterium]